MLIWSCVALRHIEQRARSNASITLKHIGYIQGTALPRRETTGETGGGMIFSPETSPTFLRLGLPSLAPRAEQGCAEFHVDWDLPRRG
ncbi:hypothetical protein N7463_004629 [Penicillium fimorum]|uniref:Uncharacterized protein n=1 Tax=Penicillium fimorum TaxID=1882269 RepID=A0A9W9Y380_9EURO|nr:hypothetical protein N7463_004629 [Penicillium fimorum]